MRSRDKDRSSFAKAAKTISFDKVLLKKLERRADIEGTNVSNIVNRICWDNAFSDEQYYKELARHHWMEFQKARYMKEQSIVDNEVNQSEKTKNTTKDKVLTSQERKILMEV